jgi:membrane fusion protein (multidrug efflux system)
MGAATQAERDHASNAARSTAAHLQAAHQAQVSAEAAEVQARVGVTTAGDDIARATAAVAQAQAAQTEAEARRAGADTADTRIAQAQAQAALADADVAQAQAALAQARIDLGNAVIRAPFSGWVTHHAVEVGAYVNPGQTLLGLVGDELWVTANFKETQLTQMLPGQPADLRVDTYDGGLFARGITFHGKVDSIQAGSGARFALLPPENATGNYVKVLQRIPVKIVFDPAPDGERRLVPGMSVVPTVHVWVKP